MIANQNMQIGENKMTAKTASKKVVKTTKKQTAKAAEIVETAAQLPAQLPAATSRAKEQPMWQGKPISAAGLVYHQRREAGVCVKCGQPLAEGSKLLCTAHLEYHNKWHAARKAKIDAAMELLAKQAAPVAQAEVVTAVEAAPKAKASKPAKKTSKK
jgi:hypothetical protein